MPKMPIRSFQQMQWPSLILTLVLVLAFVQCTWMKFSALAERLTSLTALEALLSSVLLLFSHMQEYDVKVWRNDIMILYLSYKIVVPNLYPQFL